MRRKHSLMSMATVFGVGMFFVLFASFGYAAEEESGSSEEGSSEEESEEEAVESSTLYGALYEAANVTTEEGVNGEATLVYHPGSDGFALGTTNTEGGLEWWTSDALGINWALSDEDPLAEYECTQIGRHTPTLFNDTMYFGANCKSGGLIFKMTGLNSVELVHTHSGSSQTQAEQKEQPKEEPKDGGGGKGTEDPADEQKGDDQGGEEGEGGESGGGDSTGGFPTATKLGDDIYFFFDGGFTVCDTDDKCSDVSDAEGQPSGVPLEVSTEQDGFVYAAMTSGEVMTFDGDAYETIGTNYLLDEGEESATGANLPAIEVYNGVVYVGNIGSLGTEERVGATLYKYDPEDEDGDDDLWEVVVQLSEDNTIINKMQLSKEIDGTNYLVFYSSNGDEGTNIYAVDETGTILELVPSGLGGENPENNREVVSIVNRTVTDDGVEKNVMLFGTQNTEDHAKVFVLQVGTDLAYTPESEDIVTAPSAQAKVITATGKVKTQVGKIFTLKVPKDEVEVGDVLYLYVNDKKVDTAKVKKKKAVVLKYRGAKKLKSGKTFTVTVGRKLSYGEGKETLHSSNVVVGDELDITVKK